MLGSVIDSYSTSVTPLLDLNLLSFLGKSRDTGLPLATTKY